MKINQGIAMKIHKLSILVILLAAIITYTYAETPPQTMPDQSRPIVIYGDSRTYHDDHRAVINAIERVNPKAVFHTGDLVGDGRIEADWDTFFVITERLLEKAAFYPALGNHEHDSPYYYERFDLPGNEQWYSVLIDGIKIIVLNSCTDSDKKSEQYKWLENELKNTGPEAKFKVALFHHPPYSSGPHDEDEKGLRKTWVPLFKKHGVDIVFNGHDHIYERSRVKGVYYVIAAGGGAPLYDIEKDNLYSQIALKKHNFCRLDIRDGKLIVETLDTQLNRLDYFEIE
jgi:predicted phosphodiesterase